MLKNSMPSKGKPKAQAALEYLITYGWALIAVATIIGVLVFAASGGVNTNTCTTFLTIICKGIGVDGDTMIMVLQNATGQTISITPFSDICFDGKCGYAAIEYDGTTYRFESVEIPAGTEFKIFGYGQVLAKELSITYTEGKTGLTKTIESNFGTEAPNNTELSNDGIDNDGDGLTDCEDTDDVISCEYVVTVTGPAVESLVDATGTNITFTEPTIAGGPWDITKVYLSFYVPETPTGTPNALIQGQQTIPADQVITTGWNTIESTTLGWTITNEYIEITTTDGSFKIASTNDYAIKLVVKVESAGGGE